MKVAIVGAGKLGFKVTEALLGGDHSVTVIDVNENALNKLITQMDIMTVNANGKEIRVLESIGISTYDFLLACTNSDEQNITIAAFAKKLGCSNGGKSPRPGAYESARFHTRNDGYRLSFKSRPFHYARNI